jgi:hypothetical protein
MTSDFWPRLRASFRSMRTRYGDRLAATCCSQPMNQGSVTWSFLGSTGDRELDRFKVLSARAAWRLGCSRGDGAIAFWLDSLRAESPYRTVGPLVTYCDARGGQVTVEYEMIDELYKASAEYCRQLANRYSSVGFEASLHASKEVASSLHTLPAIAPGSATLILSIRKATDTGIARAVKPVFERVSFARRDRVEKPASRKPGRDRKGAVANAARGLGAR